MELEKQKNYVRENALSMPLKRIAKNIGRSSTFVSAEMKRQGIVVPQYIKDGFRKDTVFKKGQRAWNKDRPQSEWMTEEAIKKTRQSTFKKGNVPHNTKSDYHISLRRDKFYRYFYIRLKKSKWVLYHRWIWENIYGEIPIGSNIQFKDGDRLNCNPENLYLIGRRDQALVNKHGGAKIPYELQSTIILMNKLKNKINEKQDSRFK